VLSPRPQNSIVVACATIMLVVLFSLLGLGSCVPFLGIGSSLFISGSDPDQDPPVACLLVYGTCYQGRWTNSTSGKPYASFQGVRYAQPPLGELRFRNPQPFLAGEILYDVSEESTVQCPQPGGIDGSAGEVIGQEDCLMMNIYSPNLTPETPLPVMVWIHGGGLITGSNIAAFYGASPYIDRDVLLVSINYRLGPLGFHSLGDEKVPGNAGLRDQALALKWISENIADFGGDSGRVTIFGESAGSSSVNYQMLSPLSRGTFQRAIMQSGTVLGVQWGSANTPEHAVSYGRELIRNLGCDNEEDTDACMQNASVEAIVENTYLHGPDVDGLWQAVDDSSFTSEPFLPGAPIDLLESGEFNTEVEVILGTTKDEGIIWLIAPLANHTLFEEHQENWDSKWGPLLMGFHDLDEATEEDLSNSYKLLDFYIGGLENLNEDHLQGVFDMYTDSAMLYGVNRTAELLLSHGVRVWQYILTHQGQNSLTELFGLTEKFGVCHADDLYYLFDPVFGLPPNLLSGEDALVGEVMLDAWTSFAKSGDPAPPSSTISWPSMEKGELRFLNISGPAPSMDTSTEIEQRMDIWASVMS